MSDAETSIKYKPENIQSSSKNISDTDNGKDKETSECSASTDETVVIGPTLPPDFLKEKRETTETIVKLISTSHLKDCNSESTSIGPVLPSNMRTTDKSSSPERNNEHTGSIGPQLPPHMLKKQKPLENTADSFGPQLPPHMYKKPVSNDTDTGTKTVGPTLPPHLKQQLQEQAERKATILNSDDEEELYGPLPTGMKKYTASEIALEERALQLQIDQLGPQEDNTPARESWMIDLPESKAANLGLGPRQFRNRAGPDMSDRSSWTDIPGEKGKQKIKPKEVDLRAEAEMREQQRRDKEQELMTRKHKRKSKSLVEIHQDKIKKKHEGSTANERTPFNRETDLQVNKFDEAQRKAVLKKAQLLDDRFSAGKSKYL